MNFILRVISILLISKLALAIETGSYLPTNPSNKIDFEQVNDLADMIKSVKPPLKTRGIGQNIFKSAAPATAIVVAEEGMGSGFLINMNGHVVTNYHVIEKSNNSYSMDIKIAFCPIDVNNLDSVKVFQAKAIKVDPTRDLALLKLNSPVDLSVSSIIEVDSDLESVEIGMDVHAIGHPDGGSYCTYTKGVVSQYKQKHEWAYSETSLHKANVIQTQTPINPGNSGGPLMNDDGNVIGINTFIMREVTGINFAVSANEIEDFIRNGPVAKITPQKKCTEEEQFVERIDLSENGVNDLTSYDTDCNGVADLLEFDNNEDGIVDNMIIDSNENGVPDMYVSFGTHTDGDLAGKRYAIFDMDEDEDDKIDNICIDLDLDGELDHCEPVV